MRVLCPDCPGIGLSEPRLKRTIRGYPNDVTAVAEALGIESFVVLVLSGRAYALACGAKLSRELPLVGLMPFDASP